MRQAARGPSGLCDDVGVGPSPLPSPSEPHLADGPPGIRPEGAPPKGYPDDLSTPRGTQHAGWPVAIAATLGMSVSFIDRQTLAAIAPSVRTGLGLDRTQYGWLLSAFSMAYLVGAPLAGAAVDKLGARRGFALAVVAWSFVAGAHALATSFAMLFLLRILLGATEAPSFPAAAQSIRRALPSARRSAAYGLLFTGSSIGAVLAAPVAIALEGRFGFRLAFLGTTLIGLTWVPFWLVVTGRGKLPETDAHDDAAPAPVTEPYRVPARRSAAPPARWIDVVRSPAVLRALVAVVGSAPGLMFILNWTSQYLVEAWQLPRANIGGQLVVAPLLFDVGAVGFGALASRRDARAKAGEPRRTPVDLLAIAGTLATTLALVPLASGPNMAIALLGAAAAGGGGIYVLVTADMLARVPVERTSSAGGMTAAAQSLSHIVAGPLVGAAVDRSHAYSAVLVALGLIVVPTTLAFAVWPGMPRSPGAIVPR